MPACAVDDTIGMDDLRGIGREGLDKDTVHLYSA